MRLRYRCHRIWFSLMIVLLITGSVQASRMRVGVFAFAGAGGYYERQSAANFLTKVLVDLGRFDVIERERLELIMREQKFQRSYPVDQTTAVEAGRLAGIATAFVGQIDSLTAKRERDSDGSGYYHATANVSIRIIDVSTGQLLKVLTLSGTGIEDRRDDAHIAALQACFDAYFIGELKELFALETRISRVAGDDVYLALGQDAGVKRGQQFLVLRAEDDDDPTFDFDREFMEEIALIRVTEVSRATARARVLWASRTPRVGDYLVEEGRPKLFHTGVSWQRTGVRLSGSPYYPPVEDVSNTWILRLGYELPFRHGTGLELMFCSPVSGVDVSGLGVYGSWEIPLVPKRLTVNMQGTLGIALATQEYWGYPGTPWTIPSRGSATGGQIYLKGDAGLRCYLGWREGLRLELNATFLTGAPVREWTVRSGEGVDAQRYDVTEYVDYPKVDFGGVSLRVGAAFVF